MHHIFMTSAARQCNENSIVVLRKRTISVQGNSRKVSRREPAQNIAPTILVHEVTTYVD